MARENPGYEEGDEHVAIKFLRRDAAPRYMETEILNHRELHHPHVIKFKEVFLTPEYMCLVMEYATGVSLTEYIRRVGGRSRRLQENDARWFFHQLVIALDYCHRKGVANRDIKLDNTLLMATAPPLLKICDFGFSKGRNESTPKSMVGTPMYMAPEVFTATVERPYDGKAADLWSAGVMLYFMLYGRFPFEPDACVRGAHRGLACRNMMEKMLGGQYILPDDVSEEARQLLRKLFEPDPARRIGLQGVMADPWFRVGLPEGATSMNDGWLDKQPCCQPREETESILAQARIAPAAAAGPWPLSADAMSVDAIDNEFIDGVIYLDQQEHEASFADT